jgi:AraC-like DNA-binding protein
MLRSVPPIDALSELLRIIRLDSAIFLNAEFSEPWCFLEPDSAGLAQIFRAGAAHVIIYHLLCEGRAWVRLTDGSRVSLAPGDLVTFPHGDSHLLGGGAEVKPVDGIEAIPAVLERGLDLLQLGGGGNRSRFICGFLACDAQLSPAFLGGLPRVIKVNIREEPSGQWLENSLQASVGETARREAGGSAMLTKLSEAVFAETLRRYVRALPAGETGWFAGTREPVVGRALTLLHHRPGHPWTVATLAREAGVSRTVLSERFRHFLGEPPMAYLTRWRLRLGMRLLVVTARPVAQIAAEVGYESEAAFNRAFKREYGLPPARYRREKGSVSGRAPAPGPG